MRFELASSALVPLLLASSLVDAAPALKRHRPKRPHSQNRLDSSHRAKHHAHSRPTGNVVYAGGRGGVAIAGSPIEVLQRPGRYANKARRQWSEPANPSSTAGAWADDGSWHGDSGSWSAPASSATAADWSGDASPTWSQDWAGPASSAVAGDWAAPSSSAVANDWTSSSSSAPAYASPSASAGAWSAHDWSNKAVVTSSADTPSSSASASRSWSSSAAPAAKTSGASYKASKGKGTPAAAAAVGSDADDCDALNRVWNDMGGATWKNAAGWANATGDCCSAFGVSCDEEGRVRAIQLADNGLAWSMSPALFDLERLESLDLSLNHISGPLPDAFGRLQKLNFLSLESNSLSGALPGSLTYSVSLQGIRLGNNSFTGPCAFPSAHNLTELYAAHNAFSSFTPVNGSALRIVEIDDNLIAGALPLAESMPLIENFTASSNQYTGGVFDLAKLPGLQHLSLRYNKLSGPIPDASLAPAMTYFAVDGNSFSGTFPSSKALASLKFCLVDPVADEDCPSTASNKASLAYRCHLECSGADEADSAPAVQAAQANYQVKLVGGVSRAAGPVTGAGLTLLTVLALL